MDSVPALDHGRVNQANSPLSSNSSSPSVLHPNFDRNPLTFKPRVNVDFDELHDKLRWEYGPLADPQRIRDILILCDMDLADYDGEIALQTQSQVIYAQAQRMRLFEYKTQLSGLLSPIRLLPNEILRIVFEFARTENLLQDYPWFSDMGFGPPTKLSSSAIAYLPALAISAVCKRWRVQGLALTHLWSQLRLEISYLEEEEEEESWSQTHEGFISTLQLYLGRSVDASLHIDLEIRGFWEDPSRIPALDLLLRHSRRWKTFKDTEI
ncbi:hypothetical protein BT96DRAFT_62943 [Gymnopus androsaceus JB14]|uniref:F-box domain-containing protein n=1 Tax=Gymnopus androsaceus JB14 TaxID=1447944 RepID=A0A6A4HGR1_9AGAR|nr:hypothetical protein BT96DRAFT_62943 [Gymnopus androsaceus JB14]